MALSALSEFARRHVTAALGGEGADELFGGYPRYRWLSGLPRNGAANALSMALRSVPAEWSRVGRLAEALAAPTPAAAQIGWVSGSRLELRNELLGPRLAELRGPSAAEAIAACIPIAAESRAGYLMRLDTSTWLPDDVLVKADRSSMQASLESRAPFLSRELVEFAASVPHASTSREEASD